MMCFFPQDFFPNKNVSLVREEKAIKKSGWNGWWYLIMWDNFCQAIQASMPCLVGYFFSFTNSKREIHYAMKLGSDKTDLSILVRISKYHNLFALMFLNHNKQKMQYSGKLWKSDFIDQR